MIPWAIGAGVHFVTGEGPKLTPLTSPYNIDQLSADGLEEKLAPVGKALALTRQGLDDEKASSDFVVRHGQWQPT